MAAFDKQEDDTSIAHRMWQRYVYMRDSGHIAFVKKADMCNKFFMGDQWDPLDKQILTAQHRPALTINKILPTLSTLFGEQIKNRAEVVFRPTAGANPDTADALTKLYNNISDRNQLQWLRSEIFADGCITSRGYIDLRMDFDENIHGDAKMVLLNPKNVLPDPDADQYDPDTWNDVMTTKWMSYDDISLLYSQEKADRLKGRETSAFPYSWDSVERFTDKFGQRVMYGTNFEQDTAHVMKNIRVLERQYRVIDKRKFLVDLKTGDRRPIPEEWDDAKVALITQKYGLGVMVKRVKRIRWTVTADDVVLHDDWSPYSHFTVIPYFPNFRRGQTVGLVENLVGPQELLNKVSSQELHTVNTSANSGWIVKTGSLVNMSIEELENRGATTGLVLETKGEPSDIQKIVPNQTPSGLDRISYKAEEHVKTISNVSDSMQGFDREDVAAKAIQMKSARGSINQAKILDNLARTDHIIARNVLDLIQEFYTEERVINITQDRMTGEQSELALNQEDPSTGEILNDLTLGDYDVVVVSVPDYDTIEDSQFQQAVSLREIGVAIDDSVLIENSRLMKRGEIVKAMQAKANSVEAQKAAQMQEALQQAELAKTQAEAQNKAADAGKKAAETQQLAATDPAAEAQAKMQADMAMLNAKLDAMAKELEMKGQAHAQELNAKAQATQQELNASATKNAQEAEAARRKTVLDRIAHRDKMAQNKEMHDVKVAEAKKPKPTTKGSK